MESKQSRVRQPWLVVAFAVMLFAFALSTTNVAAQDDSTPVSLPDTGMSLLQATPADDDVEELPETGMVIQATPEPSDDDVAELPATGAGSSSDNTGVIITALALATSILGVGAVAARRMMVRN
jgi:hypothetical protein